MLARRLLTALLLTAAAAQAQTPFSHAVAVNVVYNVASGQELKLDIYTPRGATAAVPVAMYIHGGGWVAATKESQALYAIPFLQMGMAVVNVEYRLAKVAPAPAAVEDCRCALRWIARNAERYKLDPNRIVVAGGSAGGHLALMTGMLPSSAGFDRSCPADEKIRWTGSDKTEPKVAAIINFFGITDVRDMLSDAPNARGYAIEWIGNRDDAAQLAAKVSPLTYVRAALPPILTIHGDADTLVPVAHARRLHEALQKAGAADDLLILPGAGHGDFNPAQAAQALDAVRAFLTKHGLIGGAGGTSTVEGFNQTFENATRNMDRETSLQLWDEDGTTLLPSTAPIAGKQAIGKFLEDMTSRLEGAHMRSFDMQCHDIHVSGDWATEWCSEHQVVEFAGGKPPFDGRGKMLLVLHRGGDGQWRLHEEMWNQGEALTSK